MLDSKLAYAGNAAQLAPGYQQAATAAPRELRVLERVGGLTGGIDEMAQRLEMFVARLQNSPPPGQPATADHPPVGLVETISIGEQRLRYCIELITNINDAF